MKRRVSLPDRVIWREMFRYFFSSRRRHTRYIGDWSSDVCSSDLAADAARGPGDEYYFSGERRAGRAARPLLRRCLHQIGRASCRERVSRMAGMDIGIRPIKTYAVTWIVLSAELHLSVEQPRVLVL